MAVLNIPCGFAFSRNPIVVKEVFPNEKLNHRGGNLVVRMDGSAIFEGRFFPPLRMDLSEIIDAHALFLPDIRPGLPDDPILEIEDIGELHSRKVTVVYSYGDIAAAHDFTAIPGGVSNQNYKRWTELGTDAFSARFLNYGGNFFLTTRTSGWQIVIKETELYPLYFLAPEGLADVVISDPTSENAYNCEKLEPGVFALDIERLRSYFITEHDVLPSIFDICISGNLACRVAIAQSLPSVESYRLKFRNSLGVFEIIEAIGSLAFQPEYDESENASFDRIDSATGNFVSDRERVARQLSAQINMSVGSSEDINFIMDMAASEEVYLLDMTDIPIRVIPSIDEFTYQRRMILPANIPLKLKFSESESNIMQDIVTGNESNKPKLFAVTFNDLFN